MNTNNPSLCTFSHIFLSVNKGDHRFRFRMYHPHEAISDLKESLYAYFIVSKIHFKLTEELDVSITMALEDTFTVVQVNVINAYERALGLKSLNALKATGVITAMEEIPNSCKAWKIL